MNAKCLWEVFLDHIDEPRYRLQVSFNGGVSPQWSADGQTLYYVRWAAGSPVAELVSVGIGRGTDLQVGIEQTVADWTGSGVHSRFRFDLHPDGRRLTRVQSSESRQLVLMQNWMAQLGPDTD